MQKIPLYLIESFVAFCESPNIVEAAARVGVTQPALSKQLKSIEELCPQPLFLFRGKRKVLTSYGQALHVSLRDRVSGLQEIIEQTTSVHADPKLASVRISARREIIDRFAGQLKFAGAIQFIEAANELSVRSVINRSTDIGIVHQMPDTTELYAKPLFRDHFLIAIPKKLMRTRPTNDRALWEQLKQMPCICYKRPDEILTQICTHYGLRFEELKVTRATANYLSVAKIVNAGVGWGALPTHIRALSDDNWVLPVPPRVFGARQFYSICRPELRNAPWFQPLLKEIASCFAGDV